MDDLDAELDQLEAEEERRAVSIRPNHRQQPSPKFTNHVMIRTIENASSIPIIDLNEFDDNQIEETHQEESKCLTINSIPIPDDPYDSAVTSLINQSNGSMLQLSETPAPEPVTIADENNTLNVEFIEEAHIQSEILPIISHIAEKLTSSCFENAYDELRTIFTQQTVENHDPKPTEDDAPYYKNEAPIASQETNSEQSISNDDQHNSGEHIQNINGLPNVEDQTIQQTNNESAESSRSLLNSQELNEPIYEIVAPLEGQSGPKIESPNEFSGEHSDEYRTNNPNSCDDDDDDNEICVEDNDDSLPIPDDATTSSTRRLVSERTMSDFWDWSLTESERQLGKVKPYWIPDKDSPTCMLCTKAFTIIRRRHHCRSCGRVLCQDCCKYRHKLQYLDSKDGRVCPPCHRTLERIELFEAQQLEAESPHEVVEMPQALTSHAQATTTRDAASPPPPYDESERSGVAAARDGAVPAYTESAEPGHLTTSHRRVMFGDGVRPGETSPSASSTTIMPTLRRRRHDQPTRSTHALAQKRLNSELTCLLPEAVTTSCQNPIERLTECIVEFRPDPTSFNTMRQKCADIDWLNEKLANSQETPVDFVLSRNLLARVQKFKLSCCRDDEQEYWVVQSRGMYHTAAKELITVLQYADDVDIIEIFYLYMRVYTTALMKGVRPMEKDVVRLADLQKVVRPILSDVQQTPQQTGYNDATLLFDGKCAGIILIRPTVQCMHTEHYPRDSTPFSFCTLVQPSECTLAAVLPTRLLLKLGLDHGVYPTPLFNIVSRESTYQNLSATMLSVFVDFDVPASSSNTLAFINGATVTVHEHTTTLTLPNGAYEKEQLIRLIDSSVSGLFAFGVSWNVPATLDATANQQPDDQPRADSHLVYRQTEQNVGLNSQTKIFSMYPGQAHTVTSGLFVVINGTLAQQANSSVQVQCNFIEDGFMIRMRADALESVTDAIRQGTTVTIAGDGDAKFEVRWIDNSVILNRLSHGRGVERSRIDAHKALINYRRLRVMNELTHSSIIPNNAHLALRLAQVTIVELASALSYAHSSSELWSIGKTVEQRLAISLPPFIDDMIKHQQNTVAIDVKIEGGAGACAEYEVGFWKGLAFDNDELEDNECQASWATWKALLDDFLVSALFECTQKITSTSRYRVEFLYTIVDCEIE